MISGDVLKYRNGFRINRRYETRRADSSQFTLTPPVNAIGLKISLDHQNAGDVATRNYQSGLLVISA